MEKQLSNIRFLFILFFVGFSTILESYINAQEVSDETKMEVINLLFKWNDFHNTRELSLAKDIYSESTLYYHQEKRVSEIVTSKQKLFAKYPDFKQRITKVEISNIVDGKVRINFTKTVTTISDKPAIDYPSYLEASQINGKWKVVTEGDYITDKNLAEKKKDNVNPQNDTQSVSKKQVSQPVAKNDINRYVIYRINEESLLYPEDYFDYEKEHACASRCFYLFYDKNNKYYICKDKDKETNLVLYINHNNKHTKEVVYEKGKPSYINDYIWNSDGKIQKLTTTKYETKAALLVCNFFSDGVFRSAYKYGRGNGGRNVLRKSKEPHPNIGGYTSKQYDLDGNYERRIDWSIGENNSALDAILLFTLYVPPTAFIPPALDLSRYKMVTNHDEIKEILGIQNDLSDQKNDENTKELVNTNELEVIEEVPVETELHRKELEKEWEEEDNELLKTISKELEDDSDDDIELLKTTGEKSEDDLEENIELLKTTSKESEDDSKEEVVKITETMPEFPGGTQALLRYFKNYLRYPTICQEQGIQGTVVVQFVVDEDGSIVDPEVIRKGNPYLDKEAIRVISNMPRWKPGTQDGKPVRVSFNLPVQFKLSN